jgi:hypothetical protein
MKVNPAYLTGSGNTGRRWSAGNGMKNVAEEMSVDMDMDAATDLWEPLKIHVSSFLRKQESSKNNEIDSRFRGNDEFLEIPLYLGIPENG